MTPARLAGRALRAAGAALAALAASGGACRAGPPFQTDDPEPTDTGRWEIYDFAAAAPGPGLTPVQAGFDINYGAAKDVQATLVLPADAAVGPGGAVGAGDVQVALKWRVSHQAPGAWTPDLSVFPRVYLPTATRRLESDRPRLSIPVWGEKDFGPWSVFGGGAYQLNPGPGNRDNWFSGLAVSRDLGERAFVGAEIVRQTPDAAERDGYVAAGLGAGWRLGHHLSLIGSADFAVSRDPAAPRSLLYLALEYAN